LAGGGVCESDLAEKQADQGACVSASQWGETDEIAPFPCHRIAFADRFCPEGVGARCVRNWHSHCFVPFKPNPNARLAALVGQR
jgi:hypothetical protein